ncbi:hypothetical protein EAF00_000958 [Botryotinia globosa]|nr:hypothetical protein EAF00_000958 [Botryotinia globosa]
MLHSSSVFLYSLLRSIYNLSFHTLSSYPEPKLAAISNIYTHIIGSPEMGVEIEEVLKHYGRQYKSEFLLVDPLLDYSCIGNVVRIARMNLYFSRHRREKKNPDIHATHVKNLEKFLQTDFEDLGEHGGISFEIDPVKHRDVARKLSPALSARNTKAKEAILHKHVDFFVEKMIAMGPRSPIPRTPRKIRTSRLLRPADPKRHASSQQPEANQPFRTNSRPTVSRRLGTNVKPNLFLNFLPAQRTKRLQIPPPRNPAHVQKLQRDRSRFRSKHEIPRRVPTKTFRMHQNTSDGLPRMSPGAIVDDNYIPRGQPEYDCRYENDDPRLFYHSIKGPECMCPASAIAWTQMKLYLAKFLSTFDVEAVSGQHVSSIEIYPFTSCGIHHSCGLDFYRSRGKRVDESRIAVQMFAVISIDELSVNMSHTVDITTQ